jgi:hypothetical protein
VLARIVRGLSNHDENHACRLSSDPIERCSITMRQSPVLPQVQHWFAVFWLFFFLAILAVLAVLVALVVLALWSRQSMAPAPQIPESLAGAPSVCTYLVHITEDRLTRTQTAFFPLPLSWPRPIGARCLVRSTGLGGRRGSSDPMHVAGVGRYRLP